MPLSTAPASRAGLYRQVISLAYPVVLSTLAGTVMGLTDTLFMGWVSTTAQGGVGLGGITAWTVSSFFVGTLTIINTFVAQHHGAGELERCGPVVWHGLQIAAVVSLLLLPLVPQITRVVALFGAAGEVTEVAQSYAVIRLLGLPVVMVETCITSFLRGIGDTRTPMKVSIGTVLLNLPLNYWLIFGGLGLPALGPRGAALATIIAQLAGALVLLWIFLRSDLRARFATSWPGLVRLKQALALLRVGLPIGVGWSLEMVTWTIFSALVATMGKEQLAAHNIVIQVLHVSFMPGLAISVAATTLVGQCLGAGDPEGAARSGYTSIKIALVYMGLMGIGFLLFGGLIGAAFSRDPEVIGFARSLFMLAAAFQIFDAIGMVSGGILRGAGDTRWPMLILVGLAWLLFMPLVWLFGHRLGWGVLGSWLGATIYIIAVGFALLARVLAGGWKKYSVREAGPAELTPAVEPEP